MLLELTDSPAAMPPSWRLHSPPTAALGRDPERTALGRATYTISLAVARTDALDYMWTCIAPAAAATVLCLPAFALPAALLTGRLALLLLLLAVSVSSRLVLAPELSSFARGKGGGLSLINLHSLGCFALLQMAAFGIEVSAAIAHNSSLQDDSVLRLVDTPIALLLLGCTAGFHVWFARRVADAQARSKGSFEGHYLSPNRGPAGYGLVGMRVHTGHVQGPF